MTLLGRRRSKLVLFSSLVLAAGALVYAYLIHQRAQLIAPAPTPILYDRSGA